ncbi:MAG: hypothetical protein KA052_01570 [Candidatus Pacebacteria bacterium]|nr:hypothetical protein [Candidatus Paceibacterota bacterium]
MRHVLFLFAVCSSFFSVAQKPVAPWVWYPNISCTNAIKTNASLTFRNLTPKHKLLFERVWKESQTNAVFSWRISFTIETPSYRRNLYVVPPKDDHDGVRFYLFTKDDRTGVLNLTVYFNTEYGVKARQYPDGSYKIIGLKCIQDCDSNMQYMGAWFPEGTERKR